MSTDETPQTGTAADIAANWPPLPDDQLARIAVLFRTATELPPPAPTPDTEPMGQAS
jgi:hypothetical protein